MDPAVLADLEQLLGGGPDNLQVDHDLVRAAVELAHAAHRGQLRDPGEPYIYHPLKTAHIRPTWRWIRHPSSPASCDVVEDTA